jgi:tRNA G46 methylase TrmB
MNIEIVKILKKYGCAYMETDNKEMLEEIENFVNKQEAAISVTRCCTELKDKETLSFEEWLRVKDIKMHQDGTFYISDERRYVKLTFLINRYNSLNL